MPLPSNVPQQGQKPANVTQTVKAWAEELAQRAQGEAAKRLKVGEHGAQASSGNGDWSSGIYPGGDLVETNIKTGDTRVNADRHANLPHAHLSDQDLQYELIRATNSGQATRALWEEVDRRKRAKASGQDQFGEVHDPSSHVAPPERHSGFPTTMRHAFAARGDETKDPINSDFFESQLNADKDAAKRERQKRSQANDPTATAALNRNRAPGVQRHALVPPGFDHVVRRLGGSPNAHSVAWAMHDRERASSDRHAQSLESIDFVPGCYSRNLRILDAIAGGKYRASKAVIDRAADDAIADLSASFDRHDTVGNAWRHVLEDARRDALQRLSSRDIMRHTYEPIVTIAMVQRHASVSDTDPAADFTTDEDGEAGAKLMADDADHCAGLDPEKHWLDELAELDRHAGIEPTTGFQMRKAGDMASDRAIGKSNRASMMDRRLEPGKSRTDPSNLAFQRVQKQQRQVKELKRGSGNMQDFPSRAHQTGYEDPQKHSDDAWMADLEACDRAIAAR